LSVRRLLVCLVQRTGTSYSNAIPYAEADSSTYSETITDPQTD